jgi:transcriptional regulator GlxA family with amidase domain
MLFFAAPGAQILDLVGPFQVFARANEIAARAPRRARRPLYALEAIAGQRGLLRTSCGLRLEPTRIFDQVRGPADTLLVAGGGAEAIGAESAAVVLWLRRLAPRLRRLGSICTGAFLLARAGLLDGRRATTHWKFCDLLARRHPKVRVERDPIFVRDGNVFTSAGVTAGMDLALALVEDDHGSALALEVARELVLYLRRPGGQSQFSAALSAQAGDRKPFRELGAWVLEHLRDPLTVAALAAQAGMSPRNFSRVFSAEMGASPAKFVELLRLETARRRLQQSAAPLDAVAAECGFRNADALRSAFQRVLHVAPSQYRARFRSA